MPSSRPTTPIAALVIAGALLPAAGHAQYGYPQYAAPPGYGYPQTPAQQRAPAQPPTQYPQQPYAPWGQQPAQPYAAQPQQPWGRPPQAWAPQPQPQQPGWGQPAQPPQAYSQPSYTQPQYQQARPAAPRMTPPQVEVTLAEEAPYAQQSVALVIRLVSDAPLSTATPELPRSGDVVFKSLEDPKTYLRGTKSVTEYRYAITPLRPAELTLPPIRITGTYKAGGQAFDAAADGPLHLSVRTPPADVQPWLPLHGLIMQSFLKGDDAAEEGKPITLSIDISAVGATGAQLPSMEHRLKGTSFRIYREKSDVKGVLSNDGRYLLGTRSETFTLVPLHGGKLTMPALDVTWWNVDTQQRETVTVPMRMLVAKGQLPEHEGIAELFPEARSVLLWIPLIAFFAVTLGFAFLAWIRHKAFFQVVEEELGIIFRYGGRNILAVIYWLSPIRRAQQFRQFFVRRMPRSTRLWFCVRTVEHEDDPEVWSYMLRFLANKHLGLPTYPSMEGLGQQLASVHPGCNPEAMRELMRELDSYLYGHGGKLDFGRWKRAFRKQLKPRLFGRSARSRVMPPGLPTLNPQ